MDRDLLSIRVYDRLFSAMIRKRLSPGDRLNRRQVATDLGVSVAPVLEAMTQLEWEGFLETKPRRGTVVKAVTPAYALGRFLLRQAIEVEAARRYAGAGIAKAKPALLKVAHRLDAIKPDSVASFKVEADFHGRLVAAAGCQVLSEAFSQVMRHGHYHAALRMLPLLPPRSADLHVRLVETLSTATPEQADAAIRGHLQDWITVLSRAAATDLAAPAKTRRRRTVRLGPVRSGGRR